MKDCPFIGFCMENTCDRACPRFAEISYLLERNGILESVDVYVDALKMRDTASEWIKKSAGKLGCVISANTISTTCAITYAAVCENWLGNQLHCSVYNLKFSQYLDLMQKSWSAKDPIESLEMIDIWIRSAKILIVSNIDFVQFKDFQAQILLNLIHERMDSRQTTIVVSPSLNNLVGNGAFYTRLRSILGEAVIAK